MRLAGWLQQQQPGQEFSLQDIHDKSGLYDENSDGLAGCRADIEALSVIGVVTIKHQTKGKSKHLYSLKSIDEWPAEHKDSFSEWQETAQNKLGRNGGFLPFDKNYYKACRLMTLTQWLIDNPHKNKTFRAYVRGVTLQDILDKAGIYDQSSGFWPPQQVFVLCKEDLEILQGYGLITLHEEGKRESYEVENIKGMWPKSLRESFQVWEDAGRPKAVATI
jgi:hypothetical protein